MNELIAAFTTPYTMQSVNLMLTYTECYACIALFARRFERRDFFLVRIILTLLEGMVVCYLLDKITFLHHSANVLKML